MLFAFLTGYEEADFGAALSTLPRLAKPFGSEALKGVVLRLLTDNPSVGCGSLPSAGCPATA